MSKPVCQPRYLKAVQNLSEGNFEEAVQGFLRAQNAAEYLFKNQRLAIPDKAQVLELSRRDRRLHTVTCSHFGAWRNFTKIARCPTASTSTRSPTCST